MTSLHSLWLPIVLGPIFAFVASFILHMVLPWHRQDLRRVPQEDQVMNALRPFEIPPGDYMLPKAESPADMKSPEMAEKMKKGPVAVMTVMEYCEGGMGKSLALWFVHLLIVSLLSACVASHVLGVGAGHRRIFHTIGVTAFLGFSAALWQMWIWWRRSLATTIKATIDGAIYAALLAGTFAWLWPR